MANMSYCRFENTLKDLRDCYKDMSETDFYELFAETYTAFVYDNNGLKTKNPNLYNTFVQYLQQIGVDINTIKLAN